jgi:hypothetical protein
MPGMEEGIIILSAHSSFELEKLFVQLIIIPMITSKAMNGILLRRSFKTNIRTIEPIVSPRVKTLN